MDGMFSRSLAALSVAVLFGNWLFSRASSILRTIAL